MKKKLFLVLLLMSTLIITSCNSLAIVDNLAKHDADITINIKSKDTFSSSVIIKKLTSKKYSGRLPGTAGNTQAVDLIVDEFKKLGLSSFQKYPSYKQTFQQQLVKQNTKSILEVINNKGEIIKSYKQLSDFIALPLWAKTKIQGDFKANLVQVKNLTQLRADNSNLKNKVLLIDNSVALQLKHDRHADGIVARLIELKNIKGAIINYDNRRDGYYETTKSLTRFFRGGKKFNNDSGPCILYCSNSTYDDLVNTCEIDGRVHIALDFKLTKCTSSNVIGSINSNKNTSKNIVIAAHLDHIGDNKDGTYNPGALDNASGVAGLLKIASELKQKDYLPNINIIFIAFNGEEEYLAGSNYYVANPVTSLSNTLTMINLDMIGAKHGEELEICYAKQHSFNLCCKLQELAKEKRINAKTAKVLSSDHVTFSVCGVSAVMLKQDRKSTIIHTVNDTYENNIDITKHQEAVDLVVKYLEKAAYS